jgi:hypothetical protein
VNQKEQQDAFVALNRWFVSQDIGCKDAAWLCSNMAGYAVGIVANDKLGLSEGVDILTKALRQAANRSFEEENT